jgi:hypothetical protein
MCVITVRRWMMLVDFRLSLKSDFWNEYIRYSDIKLIVYFLCNINLFKERNNIL